MHHGTQIINTTVKCQSVINKFRLEEAPSFPLWLSQVLNSFPMLLRIPGLIDKIFSEQKAVMGMVGELVTEHKMTRDPSQPPRDLTDAFLVEMEKVRAHARDRARPVG